MVLRLLDNCSHIFVGALIHPVTAVSQAKVCGEIFRICLLDEKFGLHPLVPHETREMVCVRNRIIESQGLVGIADSDAWKVIGHIEQLGFEFGIETKPAVEIEPECIDPVGVDSNLGKDVGGFVAVISQAESKLVRGPLVEVEEEYVFFAVRLEPV